MFSDSDKEGLGEEKDINPLCLGEQTSDSFDLSSESSGAEDRSIYSLASRSVPSSRLQLLYLTTTTVTKRIIISGAVACFLFRKNLHFCCGDLNLLCGRLQISNFRVS